MSLCHSDTHPFQLHIDIDEKYILIYFSLLEIMIVESTCLKVKDLVLDLYVVETAFKFIKISLILLFEYKDFYSIKH